MKKPILILIAVAAFALSAEAQTPTVTTTYRFNNIAAGNLAATLATASSETPGNGASLASMNTFKSPAGTYSVTAMYR